MSDDFDRFCEYYGSLKQMHQSAGPSVVQNRLLHGPSGVQNIPPRNWNESGRQKSASINNLIQVKEFSNVKTMRKTPNISHRRKVLTDNSQHRQPPIRTQNKAHMSSSEPIRTQNKAHMSSSEPITKQHRQSHSLWKNSLLEDRQEPNNHKQEVSGQNRYSHSASGLSNDPLQDFVTKQKERPKSEFSQNVTDKPERSSIKPYQELSRNPGRFRSKSNNM